MRRRQGGVTLVELVISIVVVAIAVVGVMSLISQTTSHSADPMIQHQAVAIAESYLEEAALLPYDEAAASGAAEGALGADTGETDRSLFDDVNDYVGHSDVGARSLANPTVVVPGLDQYTVTVNVQNDGNLGLGTPQQVPAASVELITVRVTHPAGVDITMAGYRTRY